MIGFMPGVAAIVAACVGAGTGPLPESALAVRAGGEWTEWWRSDRAPSAWSTAGGALVRSIRWTRGADGAEYADVELRGSGEGWRTRLVVARIDPARVKLALDTATSGGSPAWTIDRASGGALFAVNAGQFVRTQPWGWVVMNGRELLGASVAPLVTTVTIDARGAVRFTHAMKPDAAGVQWAFQSYPTLVNAGVVPEPLTKAGCGIDVAHRDARLAIGADSSGRVVIAMTRFDALGGALDRVPFGLTTPEMAGVARALGLRDAVLLDGGISAQLMVRGADGTAHKWAGTRAVPLALVAFPRTP